MIKRKGGRIRSMTITMTLLVIVIGSSRGVAEEQSTLPTPAGVGATWTPQGSAPLEGGGVENITNQPVTGAIHAVAPHPTDAATIYVGTVNGGIWKTTNGTAASPNWVQQTDAQTSLSVGDIEFDPTVAGDLTLVAGIGRFSSFGNRGGSRGGMLRTTDGGTTWTPIGNMAGRNIGAVIARGSTILAAVDIADVFSCPNLGLFRSTNTGGTFTQIAGAIAGAVYALVGDPSNTATLYAGVFSFGGACGGTNGIYKSTDTGASWVKVSDAAIDAQIPSNLSTGTHFELAVGNANNVYVAIVPNTVGALTGIFRSGNGGTSWTAMDLPGTMEPSFFGIHPGLQGGLHMSLVADPNNANIVYIGGDRQPAANDDTASFPNNPNSIGARNFSGRLFRGDASLALGSQFTPLTHNFTTNTSSPHADSRDMRFDANGNLLEVDDGGIYRRTTPSTVAGDWFSVNGDMQATEMHSSALDRASDIIVSGNQDNGTGSQKTPGNIVWESILSGDGGDVAVDVQSAAPNSIRYGSSQFLGNFIRLTYNAANVFQNFMFPSLTVTGGGSPLSTQFTTPIAVNPVDGTRLIIGGANSVYESMDQGNTIVELLPTGIVATGSGINSIAYGALGNADILYVAAANNDLFLRTTGGGMLSSVYTSSDGSPLQGVVIDPSDPARAFLIENARVFRTINTGAAWTEITGNLGSFSFGQLRSVEYLEDATDDALVVGTNRGVYMAVDSGGFMTWSLLGTGFPNSPAYGLTYDSGNDKLVAGTLGRGAFSLNPVLSSTGVCSSPNLAITDNNPAGVSDMIVVGTTGTVQDMDLKVEISHTYVGDLSVTLTRGATSVVTIDRPGAPAIDQFGCPEDDIDVLLDDEAGQAVEDQCSGTPPAINGTFSPNNSLAAFDNTSFDTTWTLTVVDNEAGDLGTLTRWCLMPTLGPPNDPPVATDDTFGTNENSSLSDNVITNTTPNGVDSDPNSDPISVMSNTSPTTQGITISVASTGSFTYNPGGTFDSLNQGETGTSDSFMYTLTDGIATDSATVTINITGANDPPVANDFTLSGVMEDGAPVGMNANTSDADDEDNFSTLTYALNDSNVPAGASVSETSGMISFDPGTAFQSLASGAMTNVSVPYTVTDARGAMDSGTITVEVTGVNDPPVANNDSASVMVDTPAMITVLGNDTDVDDTIDVTMVAITQNPVVVGATAIQDASGVVTYTPAPGYSGPDSFMYTVKDAFGDTSNAATVTINVSNVSPAVCARGGNRGVVGAPLSIDTSVRFTGPITTYGASGLPASLSIDTGSGVITGTPLIGDVGASPYSVTVTGDAQSIDFLLTIDATDEVVFFADIEDDCIL